MEQKRVALVPRIRRGLADLITTHHYATCVFVSTVSLHSDVSLTDGNRHIRTLSSQLADVPRSMPLGAFLLAHILHCTAA
jgi:hypothetical protein